MADARFLLAGSPVPLALGGGPSASNIVLDASTEKLAWVFQMPEAATLTHGGFLYGARTGTCPTYQISLQALDASGNPDGTPLSTVGTFTPPASAAWNSTWQWVALGASYAASRGQRLALVIEHNTGTISGVHNSSFARSWTNLSGTQQGFPYAVQDITGAWVKQVAHSTFGVKSASQVYGFPMESMFSTSFTTSGHRQALRFLLNSSFGDTFQVAGLRFNGEINSAANTYKLGLWLASDGSELETITLDGDAVGSTANFNTFEMYFDNLVTLSFGTAYYIGIESAGGIQRIRGIGVDTSNELKAFPGGEQFYLATYNGAAWTEDQLTRPMAELILADITEPSGGGGTNRAALPAGLSNMG